MYIVTGFIIFDTTIPAPTIILCVDSSLPSQEKKTNFE